MTHTLYPPTDANTQLCHALLAIIAAMPLVQHMLVFGSFARQQADRWSDIDLLVVTEARADFGPVYTHLAAHKPVLYRSTFTPQVAPSGGRILGIVFTGESVFHSLDLNFMTATEYASAGALQRFGTANAYAISAAHKSSPHPSARLLMEDFEPADEKRVADGLHFVKKNLKKLLRGGGSDSDLAQWQAHLHAALEHYQPVEANPRGEIAQVAHAYADMAQVWFARRDQR